MTLPATSDRPRPAHTDDRGSLPLSLLAIVALLGVTSALVATAIAGSRAARFDEQYTFTVQAADVGAQEGVDRLLRGHDVEVLAQQAVPPGCHAEAWTACPVVDSGTGIVDGRTYSWEARKVAALSWQVRSTGTAPSGVARTVVVDVGDDGRWFVAAFADDGMSLRGGNSADSYGGSSWGTGNGVVATNDSVVLNGASTSVDAVRLYNWDANPDFGRCVHRGGSDCDDVLATPDARYPSARIGPPLRVTGEDLPTDFIDDQLAACGSPLPDYTTSTWDGGSGVLGASGTTTVICLASMTIDADLDVRGQVEVYVAGDLRVSNHTDVNCDPGCTPGAHRPEAANLKIHVAARVPQTAVALGNHANVVAAIYAPQSECGGNPSNAQAHLFGSLICGSITTNGGWSFHYDDRLAAEGSGTLQVRAWREALQ